MLHIILLVFVLLVAAAYLWYVLRPYIAEIEQETNRVIGLLSHVPQELDAGAHVKGVMRLRGEVQNEVVAS